MWITPNPSPAFLITIGIPFSYSIADGLALGFISYAVVKAFSGRVREISWLTYLLTTVLRTVFPLGAKPNWLA